MNHRQTSGGRVSRRRTVLQGAALVALLAGLGLLGHAAWIPVKAALAQILLQRAWQETLAGEADARPWPWADAHPVARLALAGRSYVVLSGGSGEALAFAPAHLPGSAAPGAAGLSLIAGHRDTHFAALAGVGPGSEVTLQRRDGRILRHLVRSGTVVPASQTAFDFGGRQGLALVTCWPLDSSAPAPAQRFILFAEVADGN